jgi:hypothetical protein
MAFTQHNVITNAKIYSIYSTAAAFSSLQNNLLKTEMKITLGQITDCYTSVSSTAPFISIKLAGAIEI